MKSARAALLVLVALGVLTAPLAAEAQLGRVPRIGVLTLSVAFSTPTFQAFRQGRRDQGYLEGQNIALERFVDFAARARIAALFPDSEFAAAGGLMAYGPSLAANFRQAATYVVRILKGAHPADLPIERPTKFGLVINSRPLRRSASSSPIPAAAS